VRCFPFSLDASAPDLEEKLCEALVPIWKALDFITGWCLLVSAESLQRSSRLTNMSLVDADPMWNGCSASRDGKSGLSATARADRQVLVEDSQPLEECNEKARDEPRHAWALEAYTLQADSVFEGYMSVPAKVQAVLSHGNRGPGGVSGNYEPIESASYDTPSMAKVLQLPELFDYEQ
jgi:hypothetical protein